MIHQMGKLEHLLTVQLSLKVLCLCTHACVGACVCVCVCGCACLCECVRACMCACMSTKHFLLLHMYMIHQMDKLLYLLTVQLSLFVYVSVCINPLKTFLIVTHYM